MTHSTSSDPDRWVNVLRRLALVVWITIPVFALVAPNQAGRIVWTIAVASLPLFIVLVGYHRWRRICPLASVNQLAARLRRPGTRRVSARVEESYYYLPLVLFVVGLWLRLVATNGDGQAIAVFFVLLSLVAFGFGLIFTGKTWCQYVCPVSFIEKIYTEPNGLRETGNSQCVKCTACKKACPDINQENGYWKELGMRSKRVAYLSYPGLVFGFYFYYFLQSGSWDYYFSGEWTDQPGMFLTAFLPGNDSATAGFFFLPGVPRAVASLLTLVASGLVSLTLFSRLEAVVGGWLRRHDASTGEARIRHVTFTIAAFAAFVTFYSFAGQPTLRDLPWLPAYTGILVVVTATLFLARRLRRSEQDFAEEALARNVIKRWEWGDSQPPRGLHDAYLIHQSRTREREFEYTRVLDTYEAAVRESLASGFVTRADVQRLEGLRTRLQIKKADHEKVMAALAEEELLWLSDPAKQISAEKRLQLETYRGALQANLDRDLSPDRVPRREVFVRRLRAEYGVTEEEHAAVLDEIFGGAQERAARIAAELRVIETTVRTVTLLRLDDSPAHSLLADVLDRRRAPAADRLVQVAGLAGNDVVATVREGLCSDDRARRVGALELLLGPVSSVAREDLLGVEREVVAEETSPTTLLDALRASAESASPYARAIALTALYQHGDLDREALTRATTDEHELVRESAEVLSGRMGQPVGEHERVNGLTTIEKMISLRAVPIFASIEPESLAELARSSAEAFYAEGEALCRAGEPGHEVFMLLSGEVEARRSDSGHEVVVEVDGPGGIIGELAVLDPAPRAATVVARAGGVHVLRLNGDAFRRALHVDSAVADGVIRTLARRVRGYGSSLSQPSVGALPDC